MVPGVDYDVICGCSRSITITEYNTEEKIFAVLTQDMVIDDNLKRQIKNQTLCTCRLFILT